MLKRIFALVVASVLAVSLFSCGGDEDTSAAPSADTLPQGSDTTPESTPAATESAATATEVLDAIVALYSNLPSGTVYSDSGTEISANAFFVDFGGEFVLGDDGPEYPENYNKLESYAIRYPAGKSSVEIDVFKVKDVADVDAIKQMCEERLTKLKNSDILLYGSDEDKAFNRSVFEQATVHVNGKFVIVLSVDSPSVASLAADTLIAGK